MRGRGTPTRVPAKMSADDVSQACPHTTIRYRSCPGSGSHCRRVQPKPKTADEQSASDDTGFASDHTGFDSFNGRPKKLCSAVGDVRVATAGLGDRNRVWLGGLRSDLASDRGRWQHV